MCGIFGVLEHDPSREPGRDLLEASAELLAHRGPDNSAVFSAPGIGLAHTRLSLLDPKERSHQPFWDRSHRFGIVYNGEIYNFRALRAELERGGVRFRTSSDTEVLLESIVHRGLEATLPTLEGMFAFAVYDREEKTLSLARDRFGIKPLFIFEGDRSFLFSSELRALIPWQHFDLDPLRAAGYLLDPGGVNRRPTLLKGVQMVDPGTLIQVKVGESARHQKYFRLTELWDRDLQEELRGWSREKTVDAVEAAILSAVEMQQIADAPVGAMCSGGVDSSLTVAMAARFHQDLRIFHANTPGPSSELTFARAIAEHLGLELQTTDVTAQDHLELLPETILHRGSPFVDLSSSVPFLELSRLVRSQGVKAVLTGEGADECFWGFPRMLPDPVRVLRRLPGRVVRRIMSLPARLLRSEPKVSSPEHHILAEDLFAGFDTALEKHETWRSITADGAESVPPRDFQSLNELAHNLRALLNRNDGCGMAASVESRFPFLDSDLVKLAVNLPPRRKARLSPSARNPQHLFVRDKWILRQVADRYMPRSLSRRDKVPWPAEIHARMEITTGFFVDSFVRELFGFSSEELTYLMAQSPHRLKLKLLHLEVWSQMFLNGSSPEAQVTKLRTHVSISPT